jgi:iron complex outermembrane receptor protein
VAMLLCAMGPTAAVAADGAGADPVLDEITVTARRREENLQTVPIAVSVVQGDVLDSAGTVNTQSLAQLVPSLYYNSANPRNTAYTIRGLGSNTLSVSAANDGIEPGVGFYVDGVYHGRPATAAFDFTDIERIEVLRGPQGTLFGKNTTGGAISIVSRAPTFAPEMNAEVSYGDSQFMQAKTSVSGGLTEHVAARLSAQVTKRDGFVTNVATGRKVNNQNNIALRGQLLFEPSDDLRLRLIADVSDLDADCCTQSYLRVGTSLRGAARQFAGLAAALPQHGFPAYVPPSTNVFDRLTDIDAPLHVNTQDGGVSLNADWNLGAATLTSITAWRYWDWDVANDRDYIGVPIQLVQRIPSRQNQYSEEVRVASNGGGPLDYVAGLYFYTQTINGNPTSVYGPAAAYWLISTTTFAAADRPDNLADGYGQYGDSHFTMKSYAAFGELNYHITSQLTGTLGLRYTYEDKKGDYSTYVKGGLPFSTLPDPVTCTTITNTTVLNGRDNAKLSLFRPQCYSVKDSGGNVSGRANLAWQFTDEVMSYFTYARGYKAGGFNMSGLQLTGGTGAGANQPALNTALIGDEKNNTFELGLKSTLLGGRATANLAAYKTIVNNFQANIATPVTANNAAPLRTFPANIPEVQVQGVEADVAAQLFAGFRARASLAYSDGKYTDYPAGPCPLEWQNPNAVGGCQPLNAAGLAITTSNPRGNPAIPGAYVITGLPLAGLSKWVGTLGFDYTVAVGTGEFVVSGDWNVRSGYNADTSNSQYTRINGYAVADASVGYRFQSRWEVSLFAHNLFDKNYVTALTVQSGNSGLILGQAGDPRVVGAKLRVRL